MPRCGRQRVRISLQSKLKGKTSLCSLEPGTVYAREGRAGPEVSVPASGLVTALEPVLVASDGTWVRTDQETLTRKRRPSSRLVCHRIRRAIRCGAYG